MIRMETPSGALFERVPSGVEGDVSAHQSLPYNGSVQVHGRPGEV